MARTLARTRHVQTAIPITRRTTCGTALTDHPGLTVHAAADRGASGDLRLPLSQPIEIGLQPASVTKHRLVVAGRPREAVGERSRRFWLFAVSEPRRVRRTIAMCAFAGGDALERFQERRREVVGPLVEGQLMNQVERGRVGTLQPQCVALGGGDERGDDVVVGAALIGEGQR
jgi:hypothetical protein